MQNPKYLSASFWLSSFTAVTSSIQIIKALYNTIQIIKALYNNGLFIILPITYLHEKIKNKFKASILINKKCKHKRKIKYLIDRQA